MREEFINKPYSQIGSLVLLILFSSTVVLKSSNNGVFLPVTLITYGLFLLLSIICLNRIYKLHKSKKK